MSGESAAAIAKDMRAWRHLQTLAGFAAIRYETAVLHLVESALKLPSPFVVISAAQFHSTLAWCRAAV